MPYFTYQCWMCSKELELVPEPVERVFCPECAEKHKAEHDALIAEYALLKMRVMHENALRYMEKAGVYMHEYKDAAERALASGLEQTKRFYSAHEIIVAIVLDEFGYEYEANYPIGKYRADFFIPELKACLEVDGEEHKHKRIKDNERDIEIRQTLGSDWEIVRIPTEYISQNPVLIPDAIEALANEKRKLRRLNNGIIPESFSRREKKHYAMIEAMD
jgi:very-short-patch-repair endonuclease